MGKIFGYARISKTDQNLDLQKDSLLNYGAQGLPPTKRGNPPLRNKYSKNS